MTVYVSGSLSGSDDLDAARLLYERFAKMIECAGDAAYLPHLHTDPVWACETSSKSVFAHDMKQLVDADVVFAYLGEPSLGVGAEVAIAVERQIPIIAVWEKHARTSRFLIGLLEGYQGASLVSFESMSDLDTRLSELLSAIRSRTPCKI